MFSLEDILDNKSFTKEEHELCGFIEDDLTCKEKVSMLDLNAIGLTS